MKTCSNCQQPNRDEAAVCIYCGRALTTGPSGDANRTQPVRVRPGVTQPYPSQPGATQNPRAYPTPEPVYPPLPAANPSVPAPSSTQQPRWMIPLLIGMLVLVFFCAGGLAIYTIVSATSGGLTQLFAPLSQTVTPTPTPTLTLTPTPTLAPTFTPEPTLTIAPPPTLEPTLEPTQGVELDKFLSPECSTALDRLEALSNQITTEPTAPLDPAWRDNLSAAVADMRTYCGSLDSASPVPGIVGEAQRNLDLANQEFDLANQLFKEGVDTLSPGKILEAGKHVQQAVRYLNVALQELRKIGQ